jgi:hypothetical protein
MTSLVAYEPYVDISNATLMAKFEKFAATDQVINIPDWMQFYAFDVVGEFTVSVLLLFIGHYKTYNPHFLRSAVPSV